ncbi:hypothetical protein H4S06_001892 [Coemansia sp. BCRC 34490]|nr:hypothetical protein H4S06_001892 [Coemansia sp. BCRC 34490]
MLVIWAVYAAGVALYVWPERHHRTEEEGANWVVHLATVVTLPLVVYYGKLCIDGIGGRVVDRHNNRIRVLRGDLKEKLDELKKKTAFDSTKSLIDRYSINSKTPGKDEGGETGNARPMTERPMKKSGVGLTEQELRNRRRTTMPNFDSPDTQDSMAARKMSPGGGSSNAGSAMASPLAAKSMQRQGAYQGTTLGPVVQGTSGGGPLGMRQAGVVRMSPRKSSAHQKADDRLSGVMSRPWLDKLVDQLVGDVGSEEDKYALICRHCYAHNGLVLEEEIEDIQYACPKCGCFNPSVRALRARAQDDILQRKQQPTARANGGFLESDDARRESAVSSNIDGGMSDEYGSASEEEADDNLLASEARRGMVSDGEEENRGHGRAEDSPDQAREPLPASPTDAATDESTLRTPKPKKDTIIGEHVTTRKRRNKSKYT